MSGECLLLFLEPECQFPGHTIKKKVGDITIVRLPLNGYVTGKLSLTFGLFLALLYRLTDRRVTAKMRLFDLLVRSPKTKVLSSLSC